MLHARVFVELAGISMNTHHMQSVLGLPPNSENSPRDSRLEYPSLVWSTAIRSRGN